MTPSRRMLVDRHCQVCREILGTEASLPSGDTDLSEIQPNPLRQAA
jgi:hypothetical protein